MSLKWRLICFFATIGVILSIKAFFDYSMTDILFWVCMFVFAGCMFLYGEAYERSNS